MGPTSAGGEEGIDGMRLCAVSRMPAPGPLRLAAVGAALVLWGCAGVPPRVSSVGPPVSAEAESRVLALFQERASQFRQAAEQRVRAVGGRLLAVMEPGRRVSFQLLDSNDVNAYARDDTVHVTLGLLRFVQSDDELALVVGHELGHLVAFQPASAGHLSAADHERVADHYGLIGLHRAGYDILAACELWRRMATELPLDHSPQQATGQFQWTVAHPGFAERYVRARKLAALLSRRHAEGHAGGQAKDHDD